MKIKDSPNKNATSVLLLQGFVMNIGKGQTMIVCPTAGRYDVKWKGGIFPDIKRGDYITITGRLITLDLGRAFVVVGAQLLKPKSLPEIKKFIQERMG